MNNRLLSLIAVSVFLLSSFAFVLHASDGSDASEEGGPIEMTTHVYLDTGNGEIEKFDSDKDTFRKAVESSLGDRVKIQANHQIKSVDGVENSETSKWVIFKWASPGGWTPVARSTEKCPQGTNIAVKYSEFHKDEQGKIIYDVPEIDVKYTVHFYLKWDKWTKELDDNHWMRSIYDQVGWEAMKKGFWVYGNGSSNNEALADAVYNRFFSDQSLSITQGEETVTWTVGGDTFFYYGIREASYGWFLKFLGWSDTKDSDKGEGGYGTWTYWAQYRYDVSKSLDDYKNWSYNQLSFGRYDITTDRVFGLWLQTTSDEPTGTFELGLPSDIKIDMETSRTSDSKDGVNTTSVEYDTVDYMGKKVGIKKTVESSRSDGSSKLTETYRTNGKITDSLKYTYDSNGNLIKEESSVYTYNGSGKLSSTESIVSEIKRDADGNVENVKKIQTIKSGSSTKETATDIQYYSGYNITVTDIGGKKTISLVVADKGDISEAVKIAKDKSESLGNASIDVCIQNSIGSSDLKAIRDAGLSLTMTGNEGKISMPLEILEKFNYGSSMDFKFKRDLSTDLAKILTEDDLATVRDDPQLFDISLKCDDKEQTSFGEFGITVNYIGKCDSGKISVWRLDGSKLVYVGEASYNSDTGMASFTADHLSTYILNEKVESESSSLPTGTIVAAVVLVVIVVAAFGVIRIIR